MKLTPEELEIIEAMFNFVEQQFGWLRVLYEQRTGEEIDEDVFDNLLEKLTEG